MKNLLPLIMLAALVGIAGAGGAAAAFHAATPPSGKLVIVDMNDLGEFLPIDITVGAGDTVEWRNIGLIRHTVTDNPGDPASRGNEQLPAGARPIDSGWINDAGTFRYTFTTPGFYRYVCLPHENIKMIGTVTVL